MYDAFSNEALSKSINYSESEQRGFWFEQGKVQPREKLMICATSLSNYAEILGLAVIEPVSISEVDEDDSNGIDPIHLLLLSLRKVFWKNLLQKYPLEQYKLDAPDRYFRFSYLAVSPSAWGQGIAGKLLNAIPRFIGEFQVERLTAVQPFFVYAETSSKRSQKIFGSRGFESWTSVRYDEHRKRYSELAATFKVASELKIGPCEEEEMLLQVRFYHVNGPNHSSRE
jgi:GNAT superfamily N-acetyltransferase